MKEEFGKMLLDIAKYVMTGVLLATLFNSIEEQVSVIIIALCIVTVALVSGGILL
jgi:hypothetical protein